MSHTPEKPDQDDKVRANAAVLRDLRNELLLNQAAFAARVGVSQRTISKMETGGKVRRSTIKLIADELNIEYGKLLLDYVSPSPPAFPDSLPPEPTGGLTQLPPASLNFVGRTGELVRLTEHLEGEEREHMVVWGMGGVGKTSLAVRAGHDVRGRFPDGLVFVDLDGMAERPLTPEDAMRAVIQAFHPEDVPPVKGAGLVGWYRRVLAGRRALVLLDNARDEAHVRELLDVSPPVRFLVTSRRRLVHQHLARIELGLLARGEALSLLRAITERGTRDELGRIADMCGDLPLALRVAGDFIRVKTEWSVAAYIDALSQEQLRWLKAGTEWRQDVNVVLTLSAAQLRRDDEQGARRWAALAELPNRRFTAAMVASAFEIAPRDALVGLSELVDRSLVLYEPDAGRYFFHDLMREVALGLYGRAGR